MTSETLLRLKTQRVDHGSGAHSVEARQVYFSLLQENPDELVLARSRIFITRQLEAAEHCSSDLPEDMAELEHWSASHTARVGGQYRQYLDKRRAGEGRQYFKSKAHALYFLKAIAPTKLVDGAWLYGLLDHWEDARFSALIQIYLEELGEGDPGKNHVVLYKKLLATHECDQWKNLADTYFMQGAIQLALARHADHLLPEVIGFNLGYEQLPLHLLITAYELNELGIDPYYFTLHITVDNAASGHATKALQGVFDAFPRVGDRGAFYRRVVNGYKLNALGASSNSVIDEFNLYRELLDILASKCGVGAFLHSDYARIGGKSVNQWLSDPDQLPEFLNRLQQLGWIKRHQDPQASRFWQLIDGPTARMWGVFTAYERQVVYDWIAGRSAIEDSRYLSYKARQSLLDTADATPSFSDTEANGTRPDDFNMECRAIEEKLARFTCKRAAMAWLTHLMSPLHHHTAAGLMATRVFCRLLGNP